MNDEIIIHNNGVNGKMQLEENGRAHYFHISMIMKQEELASRQYDRLSTQYINLFSLIKKFLHEWEYDRAKKPLFSIK